MTDVIPTQGAETRGCAPGSGPSLVDDAAARARVWARARGDLDGLPGGRGLNIAHEAVDRHTGGWRGWQPALRWLGRNGERRVLTYRDLQVDTNRFANALRALGVWPGERVFCLLGRVPELYVAALGTLKAGAVFCPLFSAFGPQPVRERLALGDARVLITTAALYHAKVAASRGRLPGLRHVLLTGGGGPDMRSGVHDLGALLGQSATTFEVPATDPQQPALLHFTSGTTGAPKGALHVHEAVVAHQATAKLALGLRAGDVFWCTADPGWVTGISYGVIAPLVCGATVIVDEADFDAERWYRILAEQQVAVWYTAPTAVRRLMRLGEDVAAGYDFGALRLAASVGEPLSAEAVRWGRDTLGLALRDTWWQTETGAIMIANTPDAAVRPGSMGRPLPGVTAAILRVGSESRPLLRDGHVTLAEDPGEPGLLALRPDAPSMFRGYLDDPVRTRACFVDGWYLTGDLARRDADGWFWFVARADDVILSAGHRIGPFEIESALAEHPAVAEAGVFGRPDPTIGEVVVAVVVPRPGVPATPALRRDLLAHTRRRLGPAVAPRDLGFADDLPKTRSGKVLRRLLRARALGLDEGDLSMLEAPAEPSG